MPSNYFFEDGNITRNFDDIFVTRDSFDSTSVGGPGNFTVSGQDIEDYFIDDQSVIDNLIGDTLFTWGANTNGQLGHNDTTQRNTPTQVGSATDWKQVSNGSVYMGAVKTNGTLWTWGRNSYGQLGHNDNTQRNTPTQVGTVTTWKQISCNGTSTAGIRTNGTLWTWGRNSYGQLGLGNTVNRLFPVQVGSATNWKQVSSGTTSMAAIKTNGELWTWGRNNAGQLGIYNLLQKLTPVTTFLGGKTWKKVSSAYGCMGAIKQDGTLWTWGGNGNVNLGLNDNTARSTPTQVGTSQSWKEISAYSSNMAAIKTDGTLWVWGLNFNRQLGTNTTDARISTPVTTFLGGNNWKTVSMGTHTGAIKIGLTVDLS
jgi:alpha-tubulin suppressor-like RCC1 family protein